MTLMAALRRHAEVTPGKPAIRDSSRSLTYADVVAEVERLGDDLVGLEADGIALLADNGSAWALVDLALHVTGVPALPLPTFFSAGQIRHALEKAGIVFVLTDQPERLGEMLADRLHAVEPFAQGMALLRLHAWPDASGHVPPGTTKITFTSGTTGEPKGVCLDRRQIEAVAAELLLASQASPRDTHLCLLPLPTLLENIAGLYVPLLVGAEVCVPALAEVGLSGSSGLDVPTMMRALVRWDATTAIAVPQMLQAMLGAVHAGMPLPPRLRYVAVGGAPVSVELLEQARACGLPAFEGYGLSECGSVVAVNRPDENRIGSVGRPLPHLQLEFAEDGEILVHGTAWQGYLGVESPADNLPVATGDLGHLDAEGFLHLTGRKKNIFITSFGRNVAPEWVERELVVRAPLLQAVVFGEGEPFNVAVVFARPDAVPAQIDAAIDAANATLPDYARVAAWIAAAEPLSPQNGMLTANGRPRRPQVLAAFGPRIAALRSKLQPIITTP